MSTYPRFDTEAQGNSEMAYSSQLLQSFQEKFKTMAMHNLGWGFGIGSAGSQIEHINDGEGNKFY